MLNLAPCWRTCKHRMISPNPFFMMGSLLFGARRIGARTPARGYGMVWGAGFEVLSFLEGVSFAGALAAIDYHSEICHRVRSWLEVFPCRVAGTNNEALG